MYKHNIIFLQLNNFKHLIKLYLFEYSCFSKRIYIFIISIKYFYSETFEQRKDLHSYYFNLILVFL